MAIAEPVVTDVTDVPSERLRKWVAAVMTEYDSRHLTRAEAAALLVLAAHQAAGRAAPTGKVVAGYIGGSPKTAVMARRHALDLGILDGDGRFPDYESHPPDIAAEAAIAGGSLPKFIWKLQTKTPRPITEADGSCWSKDSRYRTHPA